MLLCDACSRVQVCEERERELEERERAKDGRGTPTLTQYRSIYSTMILQSPDTRGESETRHSKFCTGQNW